MLLFLSSFLFSSFALAGPPVIWNGDDALFLNDGTIVVPGLAPGGVCKASSLGVFSVGLVDLSTEVTGSLPASSVDDGIPNRFAYFNGSGVLTSMPDWIYNVYGGASVSIAYSATDTGSSQSHFFNQMSQAVSGTNDLTDTYIYGYNGSMSLDGTNDFRAVTGTESIIAQNGANDILDDVTHTFSRIALGAGGGTNTSNRSTVFRAENRASGGHDAQSMTSYTGSSNLDSGTTADNVDLYSGSNYVGGETDYVHTLNTSISVDGMVNELARVLNGFISVNPGATVQNIQLLNAGMSGEVTENYGGLNLSTDINSVVGENSVDLQIYHGGEVAGYNAMIQLNREGDSLDNLQMITSLVNTGSTVAGSIQHAAFGSNAAVAGGASGVQFFENGSVGDGFTGFGVYANPTNIGDGDSYVVGFDASFNATALQGNLTGFNFNNSGPVTGTNNSIRGFAVGNTGTARAFSGVSVFNSGDLIDDANGITVNLDQDAESAVGANVFIQGAYTEGVTGLRLDVSSAASSSTTQHVRGLDVTGGTNSIFGSYKPFNNVPVEIGNGFFMTSTIDAGSPLTGTDQFISFIQSNLIVNDDISTGPFGLDTNMVGAVSQLQIDTGKTVPLVTSLLVGTSTTAGISGGTVTQHNVIEILGLPSFGGSAINPTRVGLLDSTKLGQSFCTGATDCWFIKNQDYTAQNTLGRLSIGVTTTTGNTKLLIHDGHLGATQTTAPTATPNANAGTGATCTVSGTDTAGEVELVTGSGAWATGAQCQISFNMSFGTAPKCQLTATNAAAASALSYVTKATGNFDVNFVAAATGATSHTWDYLCVE